MHLKAFFNVFPLQCPGIVSGWWCDARVFWYTTNKGPWIFFSVLAAVVGAFVFLMHSVFSDQVDRQNLACLALNVYFEARGESRAGQYAVAEVTMNRVASSRYPDTVCAVVHEKKWDRLRGRYVGAFSWTEFDRRPAPEGRAWERAQEVAEAVYFQRQAPQVEGALFFHSIYIKPSWSRRKKPVARIGRHTFYK